MRSALQLIADIAGLNLVASDSVGGSVTLRLVNVPWDQALDVILRAKGLDKRRNGNVIWVAPQAELAKYEEDVASAKLKEQDKVSFLIEAKQAGVFQIHHVPQEELEPVLSVVCPNMLYPYLREVVSDVSVRAGFAPVLLNPINFEALYHQQKQQEQAQAEAAAAPTTH